MSSNLPPGVTENMIPGSRPEDAEYERLFEKLPESIQDEIHAETEKGKWLQARFQEFVTKTFTEDDLVFEMQCCDTEYEQIKQHEEDELCSDCNCVDICRKNGCIVGTATRFI